MLLWNLPSAVFSVYSHEGDRWVLPAWNLEAHHRRAGGRQILITQSFQKNPEWVLLWWDNCIPNKHEVIKNYLSFFQWKLSNLGSRMCVYFHARTPPPPKSFKISYKTEITGWVNSLMCIHTHTHTPISSFYSKDTPFQLNWNGHYKYLLPPLSPFVIIC